MSSQGAGRHHCAQSQVVAKDPGHPDNSEGQTKRGGGCKGASSVVRAQGCEDQPYCQYREELQDGQAENAKSQQDTRPEKPKPLACAKRAQKGQHEA